MFGANPFRRGGGNVSPALGGSTFGLPPSLRSSAIAYWDLRNNPQTSLSMTNLVTNGDFSGGTTDWTFDAGCAVSGGMAVCSSAYQKIRRNITLVNTNKYYVKVYALCLASARGYANLANTDIGIVVDTVNLNGNYSKVLTATSSASSQFEMSQRNVGEVASFDNVVIINLTAIFGAGNEPTATEMDAMLLNAYPSTSWFDSTSSIVINPNGKYYISDTSGNSNHLHMLNFAYSAASGPQYAASPPYLKCDGTDDYAVCALKTPVASGNAFSMATWFRSADVTAVRRIMYATNGASTIAMRMYSASSSASAQISDGTPITATIGSIVGMNNLHIQFSASYTPSSKSISTYKDGVAGGTNAALTNQMLQIDRIYLCTDGASNYYAGDESEIAIFNKTLTADEVKSLYNRTATQHSRPKI